MRVVFPLLAVTVACGLSGCFAGPEFNGGSRAPKILKLSVNGSVYSEDDAESGKVIAVVSGRKVHFSCDVKDKDGDPLTIKWAATVPSGATPTPEPTATPVAKSSASAAISRADATPAPSATPSAAPTLELQQQFDWESGATLGKVTVSCTVTDGSGRSDSKAVVLEVKKD